MPLLCACAGCRLSRIGMCPVSAFCSVTAPEQLFDARAEGESLSASALDGVRPALHAANDSTALFAAEKANHVQEAAHLMELSADGPNTAHRRAAPHNHRCALHSSAAW